MDNWLVAAAMRSSNPNVWQFATCQNLGSQEPDIFSRKRWGFVPYLPNSGHVQHSQQSTPQIHNKSWLSGNLHHSAWVEGHTGGSRSIPRVHPCPQNGRRLWVARKHHNQTSPMRTNHTRKYHTVAEHVPGSTARQGAGELRIEEVCLRVDQ